MPLEYIIECIGLSDQEMPDSIYQSSRFNEMIGVSTRLRYIELSLYTVLACAVIG